MRNVFLPIPLRRLVLHCAILAAAFISLHAHSYAVQGDPLTTDPQPSAGGGEISGGQTVTFEDLQAAMDDFNRIAETNPHLTLMDSSSEGFRNGTEFPGENTWLINMDGTPPDSGTLAETKTILMGPPGNQVPLYTYTTLYQTNLSLVGRSLHTNPANMDMFCVFLLIHEHTHGGPGIQGGGVSGETVSGGGKTINCSEILTRQKTAHKMCGEAGSMIDEYNAAMPPNLPTQADCDAINALCKLISSEADAGNSEPFAEDMCSNSEDPITPDIPASGGNLPVNVGPCSVCPFSCGGTPPTPFEQVVFDHQFQTPGGN